MSVRITLHLRLLSLLEQLEPRVRLVTLHRDGWLLRWNSSLDRPAVILPTPSVLLLHQQQRVLRGRGVQRNHHRRRERGGVLLIRAAPDPNRAGDDTG